MISMKDLIKIYLYMICLISIIWKLMLHLKVNCSNLTWHLFNLSMMINLILLGKLKLTVISFQKKNLN